MSHTFLQNVAADLLLIQDKIIRTPLLHLRCLSNRTGANVWLKLENRQTGGSIKTRAAFMKALSATTEEKVRGFPA